MEFSNEDTHCISKFAAEIAKARTRRIREVDRCDGLFGFENWSPVVRGTINEQVQEVSVSDKITIRTWIGFLLKLARST